ncbi:MAG: UTP--glucose-1-phosphate uridylyltransferase GalU [Proteobacteria bacterium]|nr:UTP--glucose-1-phosphate uridylyltransferase GalU [Pseudomonadota bacterium]
MIKKAVIPAAGFGTRFLPVTKSQPKEMLPVVDKPVIQYVVEEAVASGITDILMIIGKGKRSIEEHFDRNYELEKELEEKNKREELTTIREISDLANIHFIWQKELNGLGDAVSYARHHVGREPFAVLLGDTLIESAQPLVKQLISEYEEYGESVVALEEVDPSIVSRYGVVGGERIRNDLLSIDQLVEKPSVEKAPSNLVFAGRYIFRPEIFECIGRTKPGINNEIQLTDAMELMIANHKLYGLKFDGKRYDIGNKLDFLKTNLLFGLERSDIGPALKQFILELSDGFRR